MTDLLINYLEAAAAHAPTWGYLLIFFLMAVESSFIPLPSEVVMIPAGVLAARGQLQIGDPLLDAVMSVVLGTVGSLAGAFFNYYLFRWLGTPFLERYGRYFLLPPPKLHRAEEVFRRYGAGATFFCRLLPGLRHLISIPAGIASMALGSFTLWTSTGAAIWVTILTVVGYTIGLHTADLSYAELVRVGTASVKSNMVWIAPACVVGFIGYVWLSNRIMTSRTPAPQA